MKEKLLKKLYIFLAYFTRNYLEKSNPFIIGVTWSVGKTSCRMIITQVLRIIENQKYEVKTNASSYQDRLDEIYRNIENSIYTSPKNFNSEIWLVLSLFQIEEYSPWILGLLKASFSIIFKSLTSKPWYKIIVLEYWIDHPWDMDFLLTIAKPDLAIFTKLDKVHSAYFDSVDAIWDEKFKLLLNTKKQVYLNDRDDYCKNNVWKIKVPAKFYFWWDVEVKDLQIKENQWELTTSFLFNDQEIKTNLFWEENTNYIALWLDIADFIEWKSIESHKWTYFNLSLQPGRFTLLSWINKSILVDSTYNASPESMKKMILNTFSLRDSVFKKHKIGFVIWDMRELWENSRESHKEIAGYLENANFVYTVWDETKKYVLPELEWKIWFIKNYKYSNEAWLDLKEFLQSSSESYIILFKWSQNTIFTEEALKQVLLHKSDESKLVRQSRDWVKKKNF